MEGGRADGFPSINEALYSHMPSDTVAEVDEESLSDQEDYVLPPDAEGPQNFSITVAESDQRWAEPHLKGVEFPDESSAVLSQNSLEVFYDFAKEAGGGDNHLKQDDNAVYDLVAPPTAKTPPSHPRQQQEQQEEAGAVYDVVTAVFTTNTPPTQSKLKQQQQQEVPSMYDVLTATPTNTPPTQSKQKQQQQQLDVVGMYDVVTAVSPKTTPTSSGTTPKTATSAVHQPLPHPQTLRPLNQN
jgi:hypothetical protein